MRECKFMADIPRGATKKRFDKEVAMWTYDLPSRGLFDTPKPEEMMLLARNVSLHKQTDKKVIADLDAEVDAAIETYELEVLKPAQHSSYFDAITQNYHYDVWCMIRTKGGCHE